LISLFFSYQINLTRFKLNRLCTGAGSLTDIGMKVWLI
jgi:hypothetical protein